MTKLTIGQLAQRVGVNVETIRYYEREGLMPRPFRTPNGRRSYGEAETKRLRFIRKARELDFSIEDTRALLAIQDTEGRCEDAQAIAKKQLAQIRNKMLKAIEAEQLLAAALSRCPGGEAASCSVLTLLQTSAAEQVTARED